MPPHSSILMVSSVVKLEYLSLSLHSVNWVLFQNKRLFAEIAYIFYLIYFRLLDRIFEGTLGVW